MTEKKWKSIREIPLGRDVMIKTVKGIECLAYVQGSKINSKALFVRPPKMNLPERVNCIRTDLHGRKSDVVAVAWCEPS